MISDENVALRQAVSAIASGRPVDWRGIDSSAEASGAAAPLLAQLKIVESIADLHRSLGGSESETSGHGSLPSAGVAQTDAIARWGSLQLLEVVGRGASGDVFRAWDMRLEREVALKLLGADGSPSDSVGSVVIDEARLLARIRHPNIVTVFGADRVEGRVGLWMEYVRGRTLEALLRDQGALSAHEATLVGLDLCRAVSAVHGAGLLHRDIKAQNVMREAGGRLVLMDFGSVREEPGGARAELAGTPLYLAPEIFEHAPATPASDLYSIGVLLYRLVTCGYPVTGRTFTELVDAHRERRRTWLRDARPDLPLDFVRAVEKALAFDPSERYTSAGAMEAALSRVLSASENAAPTSTRRRAWMAAAVVAAAVTAAIGAGTLVRGRLAGRSPAGSTPVRPFAATAVALQRVPLGDFSFIGGPSPDGKWFSVADGAGNVAVVDLTTGQSRPITTDASFSARASQYAQATAIAPDDRHVAFGWSALDGQYELRLIGLDGREPRVLLRGAAVEYVAPLQWSHDGTSILALLVHADDRAELAIVGVEDGRMRTAVDLGTSWPQFASLSPDGQFVVYDAPQQGSATARDIFIARSDGSGRRPLVTHSANDAQPVWTPDGRAVLFTSDRSGSNDVWSAGVTADGFSAGEPQLVHRNVGRMWLRGLTDGGTYFYFLTAGVVDVFQARLDERGVGTPAELPPSYTGSNISSLWSPDGRLLAFASRRGSSWFDRGSTTLAVRDLATDTQRELTPAMNGFLLKAWSPDGRVLLVNGSGLDHRTGTYEIDASSGAVTPFQVDGSSARPDWLSDGRIVYFSRTRHVLVERDSAGAERVLFDPRGDGGELVANINGRGFRLAADGQTLAYTTAQHDGDATTQTLRVKVMGGAPSRELARTDGRHMLLFQDWMPDGSAVIFTRWTPNATEPTTLWRVSVHGGDPLPLGLSMVGLRDVSVHPDGTRITFTAGWPTNELWTMSNFLAAK
jgi:serine/threonine-protein kinase